MKLMFMEGRLGDICGMILYDQIFKIFQKDFFKIKFSCSLLSVKIMQRFLICEVLEKKVLKFSCKIYNVKNI